MSPRRTKPSKPRRKSSVPSRRRPKPPRSQQTERRPIPPMPDYLRRLGVEPRKALGQHWLVDEMLVADIAEACAVGPADTVLEIGAGPGGLTEELAKRAGTVVAVEIDEELAGLTRERLRAHDGLHVIAADILEFEPVELLAEAGARAPYVAVGNLPYYITQPIVRRLLESDPAPRRIVVLVQREVAQRMVGGPGRESVLSLSVGLYGEARLLFDVPSRAFWPEPKVQSAVIAIDRRPRPALDLRDDEIAPFFRLVNAGFAQPRKQLHNVLAEELSLERDEALALLAACAIDPVRRPQHLALEDWGRLFRELNAREPGILDVD